MKKSFKRVSAAVIALAVVLTAFVFDMPRMIAAAATGHTDHKVCGDASCTEHSDITDWREINDASGFAGITSGNYYLNADVTLDDQVTINTGVDITLCLNDHTVTAASGKGIFKVDGGSLTLCDCKGNGKLTGGNVGNEAGGGVSVIHSGTFIMYSGTISGNTSTGSYSTSGGGGVYVLTGTFTMNGGAISGNTAAKNGGGVYFKDGTFTMNGGEISGNTADNSGGVYVAGSGSPTGYFIMNGGTISGNKSTNSYAPGGVYVYGGAEFTMNNGVISDNTSAGTGGGVYVYGSFTMNDGTISGNTAVMGGGVYIYNKTFTMTGGTISGNTAKNGGGVCVTNGKFAMTGGTISGNTADTNGGGVYVAYTSTLNGKVVITGNKKSDETTDNLCLYNSKTLTIGESFSTDSPIGVNTTKTPTGCSTGLVAVTGTVSTDISDSFTADISGQRIVYKNSTVQLALEHTYSDNWSSDITNHWRKCTGCSDKADTAEHTFEQKTSATQHWQGCSVCGYKKSAANHSWSAWTMTTDPTLAAAGTAERVCDCGEKQTKSDIPALTDTTVWTKDDTQHVDPTEEATGKDVYTSEYGEVTVTLDRLPHTLVHVDETPATETTTGTKEHWHCSGCGKDFADENGTTEITDLTIPVIEHTHTLIYVPEVPATETTTGTKEHWHCDGCNKDFADENGTTEITDLTIPVIEHTHTLIYVPEVPATETTTGTKEHWHCDGCNKDFADENGTTEITDLTIPVIEHTHTLIYVPEVPATETTTGTKEHWHCDGCNKDFADENGTTEITDLTIPVIEHTHTLIYVPEVPATETTTGTKEHWHCDGCNKDFADENGTKEVTADDLKIGKIETEVQAPMNVEIATPTEELIKAALTEDEQKKVDEGEYIKIILKVDDATNTVPASDKTAVTGKLGELTNYKLGQYLDITLLKKIGEQEQKISSTNALIRITFEIPQGLRGKSAYSVIRVHDSTTEMLPDLDNAPNTVTIETDKFSTYALVYQEKSEPSIPSTSDTSSDTSDNTSDNTSSDISDSTSSDTSSNTSNNTSSNTSDNTSGDVSGSTSESSDVPSDESSSGGESSYVPSESSKPNNNDNPATGIAVSFIPLAAILSGVIVLVNRKKK